MYSSAHIGQNSITDLRYSTKNPLQFMAFTSYEKLGPIYGATRRLFVTMDTIPAKIDDVPRDDFVKLILPKLVSNRGHLSLSYSLQKTLQMLGDWMDPFPVKYHYFAVYAMTKRNFLPAEGNATALFWKKLKQVIICNKFSGLRSCEFSESTAHRSDNSREPKHCWNLIITFRIVWTIMNGIFLMVWFNVDRIVAMNTAGFQKSANWKPDGNISLWSTFCIKIHKSSFQTRSSTLLMSRIISESDQKSIKLYCLSNSFQKPPERTLCETVRQKHCRCCCNLG